MERCGCEGLQEIVLTHAHPDHIGGVARFARRHRVPVWMTAGTWAAARDRDIPDVRLFSCHETFEIGDLQLEPMPVPHDAPMRHLAA